MSGKMRLRLNLNIKVVQTGKLIYVEFLGSTMAVNLKVGGPVWLNTYEDQAKRVARYGSS